MKATAEDRIANVLIVLAVIAVGVAAGLFYAAIWNHGPLSHNLAGTAAITLCIAALSGFAASILKVK